VSVSVTVDDTRRLEAILDNLRNFAEASCEREMAIICAVGENLRADPTLFSRAVTAKNDKPPPARIVLLSDGASNKGRSPMQAAAEAKTEGVPVSTIAFGTDTGTVHLPGYGPQPVPADKTTLREVADATGGTFHTAASAEELRSVYANIGSQIGYTTSHKSVAWRYLVIGLFFTLAAAGASLLWSGRLV